MRPHPEMFQVLFVLCLLFGAKSNSTQGLAMALCSEITAGRLRGPCGVPGIELKLAVCKSNTLPIVLSFQPLRLSCLDSIAQLEAGEMGLV